MATPPVDDQTPVECRKMLKQQKQTYRNEKKRVAQELLCALKDPTVVVMADWLKIRGTLRKWTKFYCVLKPGILLIYKSEKTHKHGIWVGTVLLNTCELIERPSKKDGFCFKLFHPLDQSIWATRGPRGEALGAVTQPLPSSYLICRAASDEAGRCWLDALELSLRCSGLLMRTMTKASLDSAPGNLAPGALHLTPGSLPTTASEVMLESMPAAIRKLDDVEAERHFADETRKRTACSASGLGTAGAAGNETQATLTDDSDLDEDAVTMMDIENVKETAYEKSPAEEFPGMGSSDNQTEEVADENKNLMWSLMKQVRPGMDLSKVVLPTFILEPRSFLERLSDYCYHADLIYELVWVYCGKLGRLCVLCRMGPHTLDVN